jgi:DNA relaxase NicK
MALHEAKVANVPAQIDYLSFTWAPDLIAAYRRLAARSKTPLKTYLEECEKPLDFHEIALEDIPFEDNAKLVKGLIPPFSGIVPELSDTCAGSGLTLEQWGIESDKPAFLEAGQIDISRLDDLCYDEIMRFFSTISRDLFKDSHVSELKTLEAWQECFVAIKRPRGMLGYKTAFDLWFNGYHIGIAASGAANGGCYISLSGRGCGLIDRNKTFEVIRLLPAIKITRLDIAVDFMEGQYSVDDFKQLYIDGEFSFNNVAPKYLMIEGGHLEGKKLVPSAGRTFYVGKRENGKCFRAYEKGKQMGDPASKWVRGEVEIRSKDREIPLYALLRPADYFAGAYPCLENVINSAEVVEVTRIKTIKKKVKITYDRLVESAHVAYGALLSVMRVSKGMTDSEIIEKLIKPNCVPRSIERALEYATPI